jgi:two-component sensor histidine kinase
VIGREPKRTLSNDATTNAVKYGTLSNESGSINVSWSATQNGKERNLKFYWVERGSPKSGTPVRNGFGTSLLKSAVNDLRLDFAEGGLICEFDLPLRSMEVSYSDHLQHWLPSDRLETR